EQFNPQGRSYDREKYFVFEVAVLKRTEDRATHLVIGIAACPESAQEIFSNPPCPEISLLVAGVKVLVQQALDIALSQPEFLKEAVRAESIRIQAMMPRD